MKQTEAASLVAYLNRAGLLQALEGQAAVWADVLGEVRYVDAVEAVRQMSTTRTSDERWVTPGDVIAAVRALRAARVLAAPPPLPNVDPDDVAAYQAERRRLTKEIADGRDPQQARQLATTQPSHQPTNTRSTP